MIKKVTKFEYNGKVYNSLKEVNKAVGLQIGDGIVIKIAKELGLKHSQTTKLFDLITSPEYREKLTKLLNVTFDETPDEWNADEIETNILDI